MVRKTKLFKTLQHASLTALLMAAATFSPMSQATDVERLVRNLCDAAKSDDRAGMRKRLKTAKMRLRKIYAGVHCGSDGSLLRTATSAGALNAATFIATKIGKKNLAAVEKDGKNIVQWTEGLVAGGDASKQAFVDLYNSKM